MRISANQLTKSDACRRQYHYYKILGVKTVAQNVNLVMGKAFDAASMEYLRTQYYQGPDVDVVSIFEATFEQELSNKPVECPPSKTVEEVRRVGLGLSEAFPEAWRKTGLVVAGDTAGKPLIQRKLEMPIGRGHYYTGVLDVAVWDPRGRFGPVDIKSAASPASLAFSYQADQLTGYQALLDANRSSLGIPNVELVGFFEGIKRESPRFEFTPVKRRSDLAVRDLVKRCHWVVEDNRAARFPRQPGMAFNTPCDMCDYVNHCTYGDASDLVFPADRLRRDGGSRS